RTRSRAVERVGHRCTLQRQPPSLESTDAPLGRIRSQELRQRRPIPGDAERDRSSAGATRGAPRVGKRILRSGAHGRNGPPVGWGDPSPARDDVGVRFFQDPLRRRSLEFGVMTRRILAVLAGLVVWVAVVTIAGLIIRATWPAYVAVSEAMTFTLPM